MVLQIWRGRNRNYGMKSYSEFAKFYDAAMGDRTKMAERFRQLILQNRPEAETVLELGCGTGAVIAHLSEEFEVTGLDLSSEMLSIARKKLPLVSFFKDDMVSFKLGKKFDIIISAFDAINHILNFSDWKKLFQRADAQIT